MSFGGNSSFTDHPVSCNLCGAPIAFRPNDKKPYNTQSNGSEFFLITSISHNDTCPVRLRKRLEEKCVWCQLDAGKGILAVGNLINFMKCERHSNEKAEISYRGKSLPMNNKTLHLMFDDALKARKRQEKARQSGIGNQTMAAFLE